MTNLIKLSSVVILLLSMQQLSAQRYFTKAGEISFLSETPMETILGTNNQANTVIDLATGDVQWAALIKAFKFEKALMEEHFNENYMESSVHPKAKFKGKLAGHEAIDLKKDGTHNLTAEGTLEIHGVTQNVSVPVVIKIAKGVMSATCEFDVLLADYDIEIPKVVVDNISKSVHVTVKAVYEELTK